MWDAIAWTSWLPRGWRVEIAGDAALLTPNTGRGGYYILRRLTPGGSWAEATYSIRYYPDTGVGPSRAVSAGVPFDAAVALIRAGDTVLRASRGQPAEVLADEDEY